MGTESCCASGRTQATRCSLNRARSIRALSLVRRGLLKANWGRSENNRRAKFFELTVVGRKRLQEETDSWNRLAGAIAAALSPQPEEV